MSARDEILATIRARRVVQTSKPEVYRAPPTEGDLAASFAKKLSAQHADVRMLDSMAEVPAAIADVLRGRNMEAKVHVAPGSELAALDLSNVEVVRRLPGPFDAALAICPYAIAETGTLAYPSAKGAPASWHFRPVLEIAIVRASSVVAELEDVLHAVGALPSTLNLVSGPSRTGDIEQTMELGAHGPKALAVLLVKD